jgi:hypothetical protein
MAGTPGWYTKLSQSGAVDATQAGTIHGSYLDFLLAEHLTERGLFIYLP